MARFKTITAKYEGTCRRCGGTVHPGEKVRWAKGAGTWHLKADCPACNEDADLAPPPPADEVVEFYFPATGTTLYQNANGRCEDAPCCGCCTC